MGEEQTQYKNKHTVPTRNSLAPSLYSIDSSNIQRKILSQYNIEDYLPSAESYSFKYISENYTVNLPSSAIRQYNVENYSESSVKESRVQALQKSQNEELLTRLSELQNQLKQVKQQKQSIQSILTETNSQLQQQKTKNQQEKNIILSLKQQKQTEIQAITKKLEDEIQKNQKLQCQLKQITKEMEKKKANIRIFCQKYEVNVEPKLKHFYTVEVQTAETEEYSNSAKFSRKRITSLPTQQQPSPEQNRRLSNQINSIKPSKPSFYQMYQEKNGSAQKYNLNNQMTVRSQMLTTNQKVKKPKFLTNDAGSGVSVFKSYVEEPEQNRRKNSKIMGRIDGKQNNSEAINMTEQNKYRIREEQLQLCPIDDQNVQHIVNALLTTFK